MSEKVSRYEKKRKLYTEIMQECVKDASNMSRIGYNVDSVGRIAVALFEARIAKK